MFIRVTTITTEVGHSSKYKRMHQTSSPLSATARRLLLSKIQVGKSRSSSVDGVDESLLHFERILEFVKRDYPELSFDHDLSERWIVVIKLNHI